MKKLLSLVLSILMLTTVTNFSSLVNAVTSIEFPSIAVEDATEETVATDEIISDETEETTPSETEAATEEAVGNEGGLEDKTILGYYNGYTVEVSGMLPKVATLSLTSVNDDSAQKLVTQMGEGSAVFACDIKIIDEEGNEWQPDGDTVEVTVTGIDVEDEKELQFLHVAEDIDTVLAEDNVSASVDTITDVTMGENGEATFTTDGFSTFVGFTVDFHYNGNVFSIDGKSDVLLSEIFTQLGIDKNVADVDTVTFSDGTLVTVEKEGNDWLLTSLKAFTSTEKLTINFADGETLEIKVTDYTTREFAIGIGNSTVGQSGITIEPVNYDEKANTIDTYKMTGTIKDNYHVTIKVQGHIQLNNVTELVVPATSKLTIVNDREGGTKPVYILFGDKTQSANTKSDNNMLDVTGGVLELKGSAGAELIFDGRDVTNANYWADPENPDGFTWNTRSTLAVMFNITSAESVSMEHVTVQNQTSSTSADTTAEGTGLRMAGNVGSFTAKNCKFSNLRSQGSKDGGGAAVYFANDFICPNVTFESCAFANCRNNNPSHHNNGGGALAFGDTAKITNLTIKGTSSSSLTTFNNCYTAEEDCDASGGAIKITAEVENVNVQYCKFTKCTAKGQRGGAISIGDGAESTSTSTTIGAVTIDNTTFDSCVSGGMGGTITVQNDVTLNNNFSVTNCTFNGSEAGSYGGAISFTPSSIASGKQVVFDNNAFTDCIGPSMGGAIYDASSTPNRFYIRNNVFTKCKSNATTAGFGGAVAHTGTTTKIAVRGNKFDDCFATSDGGALYLAGTYSGIEINNGNGGNGGNTFYNCFAGATGGAISSAGKVTGDYLITDSNFSWCTSGNKGGALYTVTPVTGTFEIKRCNFDTCRTYNDNSFGGALAFAQDVAIGTLCIGYSNSDAVSGYSNTFTNCDSDYNDTTFAAAQSSSYGGAIALRSNPANLLINGNKFASCRTGENAGAGGAISLAAVCNVSTSFSMNGNAFDNCRTVGTAIDNGGGALCIRAQLPANKQFKNNAFKDCYSRYMGGGMFIDSESSMADSTFTIEYNDTFYSYHLGAYTAAFDNCTVLHSDVNNSEADTADLTRGGAIYVEENLTNFNIYIKPGIFANYDVFRGCKAASSGAIAFYNLPTNLTIDYGTTDGLVEDGSAVDGDIYNGNTNASRGGSTFKNCYSVWEGGTMLFDGAMTKVQFDGVIIDGCVSTSGAAIFLGNNANITTFNINDSVVRNCQAANITGKTGKHAGVVRTEGLTNCALNIDNTYFYNNMSYRNGGGVYWNAGGSGASLKITDSCFDSNRAGNSGGAIFNEGDMTISTTRITKNSAMSSGGGIRTTVYGSTNASWNKKSTSLTLGDGCVVQGNHSAGNGGGISVDVRYTDSVKQSTGNDGSKFSINFTMNTGSNPPQILDNVAGIHGGGLYFGQGYIENNVDNTSDANQSFINAYTKTISINAGVIAGNSAGYDGGGIYANVPKTSVTVTGGQIYGNKAGVGDEYMNILSDRVTGFTYASLFDSKQTSDSNGSYFKVTKVALNPDGAIGYGGGICLKGTNSTLSVSSGYVGKSNPAVSDADAVDDSLNHVNGNKADFGGGIAVGNGATVNISGGNTEYNCALGGGGVYTIGGGTVNVSKGQISHNHALANGSFAKTTPAGYSHYVTEAYTYLSQANKNERSLTSSLGSGGAVHANVGSVKVTNGRIEENFATGGAGGGIFAINGGDVTVTGGYIVKNEAEGGSNSGNTTAYHDTQYAGVGGGIAVAKGVNGNNSTFELQASSTTNMAIYSNLADFAADDVYASGQYTKLDVPNSANMDLTGLATMDADQTVGWFEDFHNQDDRYINYTDNMGQAANINDVQRYKTGSVRHPVRGVGVAPVVNGVTKQAVTTANTYVCMTLGIIQAGALTIEKTLIDQSNRTLDGTYTEKFKFTVTALTNSDVNNGAYSNQPTLKGIYKSNDNTEVSTAGRVAVSTATTLSFYLENGEYAIIDGKYRYNVKEELTGEQQGYVTETTYAASSQAGNASGTETNISSPLYLEGSVSSYAKFTNSVNAVTVNLKYYDRAIVNGSPSDISNEVKTASVAFAGSSYKQALGNYSTTSKEAELARIITAAGIKVNNKKLIDNVVDNYIIFGTNTDGLNTTGSVNRTDNHGNTVTDAKWVNYYDKNNNVLQTASNDVVSITAWVYNTPKEYDVNAYTINPSTVNVTSGQMNVYNYSDPYSTNGTDASTTRYVVNNVNGSMSHQAYYNQRTGKLVGNANDEFNQVTPHLRNYSGVSGYTGTTINSAKSITYGSTPLVFSHWSFEPDGSTIVSTDYEFYYRITKDTNVYAVYQPAIDKTKGLTVSANDPDYYAVNNVNKTRLNTMINPYNFDDNAGDDMIHNVAGIYVIAEAGATIDSTTVQKLQEEILKLLASHNSSSSTATNFSEKITVGGVKGGNFYVYINPTLTNKNRAQLTIDFSNSKLVGQRILTFAAIAYDYDLNASTPDFWRVSDNCIDYKFDANGELVSGSPASIYEYNKK